MRRKELVNEIVSRTGDYKGATEITLKALFDVIVDSILAGEEVIIPKFGKFVLHERPARRFTSPSDPTVWMQSEASIAPKFIPAKSLIRKMNMEG